MMPISNAEKQRRYRLNRFKRGQHGDYRINTFVTAECYFALERLSKTYSINKRQVLESLINTADEAIRNKLEIGSSEWNKYFYINEGE